MKIGILSDSHDHIHHTRRTLTALAEAGATALIHCGDFCAPFMMKELSAFEGDVHCVFGNTDDRFLTTKVAAACGVELHGDTAELALGGKKIAVNHFPQLAEGLAATGKYDAVFYGHDHTPAQRQVGETLLANPGEVMGKGGTVSCGLYDTDSGSFEHLEVMSVEPA